MAGTARLAGSHRFPDYIDEDLAVQTGLMGQTLLDPPSVEGWYTGQEWITTTTLGYRVDFAVKQFSDVDSPGVRSVIDRIRALGPSLSPEGLVDTCLDLIGPIVVNEGTRQELLVQATAGGGVRFGAEDEDWLAAQRVVEILQLIVSSREYQFA